MPNVEQILEQFDLLVEVHRLRGRDVGPAAAAAAGRRPVAPGAVVRRRADESRAEADGNVQRSHLVDVRLQDHSLQMVQ